MRNSYMDMVLPTSQLSKGDILLPLSPLPEDVLVSVLIANFNYERYIGEAIESVQNQSYKNIEIVVCDDGSTDDSCNVIEAYRDSDSRIRLVRKSNGGHGSALNRAFAESKGIISCILDADDVFASDKIAKVVTAFKDNSQSGIVIHDLLIIDGNGKKQRIARYHQQGYLGADIATLRTGLPMPQASGLSFRREILEKILPIPEEQFRSAADWAIAYAAAFLTKTTLIPETLGSYRIHGGNLSGTTSTASTLDEKMVGKNLAGIERVIAFVDQFMQNNFNIHVEASRVRNVLEHRLIVGFLKKDRDFIDVSARELRAAYEHVRRDYPAYRYYFWQTLSLLHPFISRMFLLFSFRLFSFKNRFMNA